MIDEIENTILPLFNFMANPKEIDFDDDIISVACTLIQKRHKISGSFQALFSVLNLTFQKYKGYLKPLIILYNHYLLNGSEFFKEIPQNIYFLIQICITSLFSKEEPVESNNADAAILLQLILQYIDPNSLNDYLPTIISSAIKRLDESPLTNSLNIQLLNIIFSAFCYDSERTILLLETQGYFGKIFDKLNEKFEVIKNNYDRKILSIGLSNLLMIFNLYQNNKKIYTDIIRFILKILHKQNSEDMNKRSRIDKKVINLDDDDDEDDENGSNNSSNEIEKLLSIKANAGDKLKNKRDIKKRYGSKGINIDDEDDDTEELDSKYDTLNSIISRIHKIDEYAFFTACLRHAEMIGINLKSFCESIEASMFDFLKNVISCQRISINVNNNEISTIRKLVKAKRMVPRNEIKPLFSSINSLNDQNELI